MDAKTRHLLIAGAVGAAAGGIAYLLSRRRPGIDALASKVPRRNATDGESLYDTPYDIFSAIPKEVVRGMVAQERSRIRHARDLRKEYGGAMALPTYAH